MTVPSCTVSLFSDSRQLAVSSGLFPNTCEHAAPNVQLRCLTCAIRGAILLVNRSTLMIIAPTSDCHCDGKPSGKHQHSNPCSHRLSTTQSTVRAYDHSCFNTASMCSMQTPRINQQERAENGLPARIASGAG